MFETFFPKYLTSRVASIARLFVRCIRSDLPVVIAIEHDVGTKIIHDVERSLNYILNCKRKVKN